MEKKEQNTRPNTIPEEEEEYFDDIPTGETDEFLLKNNAKNISAPRQTSIISRRAKILHLLFFSVSLAFFIAALKVGYRPTKCNTVKSSYRETAFTPEFALSEADRAKNSNIEAAPVEHNDTTCHDPYVWCSYETRRFTDDVDSPYRVAGPEAEEIWGIDTNAQPFGISQQVLDDIDGPVDAATMPERMGGGYVASLAVHHQLHCVRILWQYSKFEYYKDVEPIFFESMDSIHQHLDHCADILRQVLMCHGDTSLITYTWWKGVKDGPDAVLNATMNLPRQCRNYDEIMRWSKHHEFKTIHLGDGL